MIQCYVKKVYNFKVTFNDQLQAVLSGKLLKFLFNFLTMRVANISKNCQSVILEQAYVCFIILFYYIAIVVLHRLVPATAFFGDHFFVLQVCAIDIIFDAK